MKWFEEIGHGITSLFFPLICPGCGNDLHRSDDKICISCFHRLPVTEFHKHASNPVEKIFWGRVPVASACSYLYFTSHSIVQHLMHELKYNGNREVGVFLGRQMGLALAESGRFDDVAGIVPLPLHPRRQKKRGYNQAEAIAEGIGAATGITVFSQALVRNTSTETQTRKNRQERWENIEGRFTVKHQQALEGRNILLIDDVVTTGATIEACARAILSCRGATVSIATLAYTLL